MRRTDRRVLRPVPVEVECLGHPQLLILGGGVDVAIAIGWVWECGWLVWPYARYAPRAYHPPPHIHNTLHPPPHTHNIQPIKIQQARPHARTTSSPPAAGFLLSAALRSKVLVFPSRVSSTVSKAAGLRPFTPRRVTRQSPVGGLWVGGGSVSKGRGVCMYCACDGTHTLQHRQLNRGDARTHTANAKRTRGRVRHGLRRRHPCLLLVTLFVYVGLMVRDGRPSRWHTRIASWVMECGGGASLDRIATAGGRGWVAC